MEGDGEDQHEDTVQAIPHASLPILRSPPHAGDQFIREPQERRTAEKSHRHHHIGRQLRGLRRTFNGGLEQRPEARRNHHAGGKSQHQIQCALVLLAKKDHRRRTQRRDRPRAERCDQCI